MKVILSTSALWCGLLLQVRVFGSQDSCIEVAIELSQGCLCNCHVPSKQLQNVTGGKERERFIAIWSAWWLGNSATWEGMGAVKGFEDFPSVLFQGLVGGSASRFCWSFPLWTLQNLDKWKEEGIGKSFEHLG
jgi:hypothetical protein